MQDFTLENYRSDWRNTFRSFEQNLRPIFSNNLTAIYHMGSTSVPGLLSKPIIDIMPTVFKLSQVDQVKDQFIRAGYEWKGEYGIEGRRYLKLNGEINDRCHVHIFEADNPQVEKHLAFRDYLRSSPPLIQQYSQLKKTLFTQVNGQRKLYQEGKSAFIAQITDDALKVEVRYRLPVQVYVWIFRRMGAQVQYLLMQRTQESGAFWQGITGAPFVGETLKVAAVRELEEETKIMVPALHFLDYAYCFPLMGEWKKSYRTEVEQIVEHVFYGEVDEKMTPVLSAEHCSYEWCSYERCLHLLKWQNNKVSLEMLHQRLSESNHKS
ncbi:MAG: GrpB family protein [Bdellovibrio sp.]|nr:GrpB family protein [Bdellovibrio sp.]